MEESPYIVCCICKNELSYIREFVEYHLNLGFDKIVIGDNNDVDGEDYNRILDEYIRDGRVVIVDLRGKVAVQKEFYNMIIEKADYSWCAFIDCDEFITFSEKTKFRNIKDFLRAYHTVQAFGLNWKVYGDNGNTYHGEGNVVDRFPNPMPYDFKFHYPFPENFHIKTILNKRAGYPKFMLSPHKVEAIPYHSPNGTPIGNSNFNQNLDYDVLFIRHFYTKSLEEWVGKKMNKGYADCVIRGKESYPIKDYFIYNDMTEEKMEFLTKKGIQYESN